MTDARKPPAQQRRENRARLMARAQQGDRDAYRRLLGDISPALARFFRSKVADSHDVEDLCQETLIALHPKPEGSRNRRNANAHDSALEAAAPAHGSVAARAHPPEGQADPAVSRPGPPRASGSVGDARADLQGTHRGPGPRGGILDRQPVELQHLERRWRSLRFS